MNRNINKCHAVISDPNPETRLRLKQATIAAPFFGEVHQLAHPQDLISFLESNDNTDIVFLSERYGRRELDDFIRQAKQTKSGSVAAFVLVLDGGRADTTTVASRLTNGIDGFLFEPYSVDSLVEIAELSAKVKNERSVAREKAVTRLLLEECASHIDQIALLLQGEKKPGKYFFELKRVSKTLSELPQDFMEAYYEIACDVFTNAAPPKMAQYSGVSARVRKKVKEKLAEEAEQQNAEEAVPAAPEKRSQVRIIKKGGF